MNESILSKNQEVRVRVSRREESGVEEKKRERLRKKEKR